MYKVTEIFIKKNHLPHNVVHPTNLLELKTKLSSVFLVNCSIIYFSPKNKDVYTKTFLIKTSMYFFKKKSIKNPA